MSTLRRMRNFNHIMYEIKKIENEKQRISATSSFSTVESIIIYYVPRSCSYSCWNIALMEVFRLCLRNWKMFHWRYACCSGRFAASRAQARRIESQKYPLWSFNAEAITWMIFIRGPGMPWTNRWKENTACPPKSWSQNQPWKHYSTREYRYNR